MKLDIAQHYNIRGWNVCIENTNPTITPQIISESKPSSSNTAKNNHQNMPSYTEKEYPYR